MMFKNEKIKIYTGIKYVSSKKVYVVYICFMLVNDKRRAISILQHVEKSVVEKVLDEVNMILVNTENSILSKLFIDELKKSIRANYKRFIKMHREGNSFIFYNDYAEIILVDKKNSEIGRTIIDIEDVDRVKMYRWWMTSWGYVYSDVNKSVGRIQLHRLVTGVLDKPEIIPDHIDRNPLNNRKSNLRLGSFLENNRNCNIGADNVSGVNGVYWVTEKNRWSVSTTFKYEDIHIVYTNSKELAIQIRNEFDVLFEKRSDNGIYSHLPISVAYDVKNEILKKYIIDLKMDKIKNKSWIEGDDIFNSIIKYIPDNSKIWIHNSDSYFIELIKERYGEAYITNDINFDNFLFLQKPHTVDYIICITHHDIMEHIKRCRMFKEPFAVLIRKEDVTEDLILMDVDGLMCIVHDSYIWYIKGY